jgi:hypothetical protein
MFSMYPTEMCRETQHFQNDMDINPSIVKYDSPSNNVNKIHLKNDSSINNLEYTNNTNLEIIMANLTLHETNDDITILEKSYNNNDNNNNNNNNNNRNNTNNNNPNNNECNKDYTKLHSKLFTKNKNSKKSTKKSSKKNRNLRGEHHKGQHKTLNNFKTYARK